MLPLGESFDRDARSLLQRAGAILASSLDIGETLRAIPPLLVPSFADTCTLYLREGDELAPVAKAVARPADEAFLQELHAMPRRPRAGLREALETGRAVLHQKLDPALLRAIDAAYAKVVERLGTHSSLIVPLSAGDQVLGVIALGYSRPGVAYSGEEAALVEELGRRAGLAVRHARVYQDLRDAKQLLQISLEQLPAGLVIAGADGRVLEMNAELRRLFEGVARASSVAEYDNAVGFRVDGTQYASTEWPIARALLTGEVVVDEEGTLQRPDGSRVPVRMSAAPLPGEDGKRIGAVASFFDYTAQRQARERQIFLAEAGSLLSESLDPGAVLERLASLSVPRLADWFVAHLASPGGSLEPSIIRALSPELMQAAVERSTGSKRPRGVLEQVLESGKPVLAAEITDLMVQQSGYDEPGVKFLLQAGFRSAMFVPLPGRGRSLGVLSFIAAGSRRRFDAADLSLAEELARLTSLAMENARLYQESERNRQELTRASARLAELLQKEQAARQQAEEATRLKDDFLAVLSHEMRTPLSSILGWTGMLKLRGQIPEELSHAIATIDRNARSQLQIVEDLLDVSRIVSGKTRVTLVELDPAGVARTAVDVVAPAAAAKGVRLLSHLATGLTVRGDQDRLQQVLWNLLSNAIKFTPAGGNVTLRLDASAAGASFSVRDDGAGIPPEFLPHLFGRFRQAQPALTRAEGGLGLGLAIARHLVELHGGTIRGSSDGPGRGSLFVVELPRSGVPRAVAVFQPLPEPLPPVIGSLQISREALRGCSVLVVEDDADARELLALTLEEFGALVQIAANAALGMEALQAGRF
ncbi:MAG TPA: ATP-binding protein, partial [Myxococcales bacterium]|nr:ATP-binding protein [Myxococcales bacterium]